MNFWRFPPESEDARCSMPAVRTANWRHDAARQLGCRRPADHARGDEAAAPPGAEQGVLGQGEVGHGTMAVALLGNVAQAPGAAGGRAQMAPIGFRSRAIDLGSGTRRSPASAARSSPWPLPAMPGDAQDLAFADLEADAIEGGAEGPSAASDRPCTVKAGAPAPPRRARRRRLDAAAHHELGQAPRGLPARLAGGDDAALTQHGRPLAQGAHLLELVADIEDRAALVGQAPQRLEQAVAFLWGQDRGRLIHDQEPRLLQETADDLDPLALADREGVHLALRVERQAIALGHLADAGVEGPQTAARSQAHGDILDEPKGPRTA